MNGELQIFQFRGNFPVRISDRDGAPWFVAADVCKALEIKNSRQAAAQLDDDERATVCFNDGGQPRKFNIISESGLYALIIRSNKPAAREFRKWITAEVLPAIRTTGGYVMPNAGPTIADPADDPAKRSTAELIEQTNRRLTAGEDIPPHVLQYVANIARISSGIWYRDSFGVDGRARRLDDSPDLLPAPDFDANDNRTAARILRIIRQKGKCTLRDISVNASHCGINAAARRRIIAALIESGRLECSGENGTYGAKYHI